MNAQRFVAANSRDAMAQAKAAFGDSAVILSSRSTDAGFEVVATSEDLLTSLTAPGATPRLAQVRASEASRNEPSRSRQGMSLQQRAAQQMPQSLSPQSSVAQDTETLAMSTLSFQDYVRERMLRKRREAMQGQPTEERAGLSEGARRAAARAAQTLETDMALPFGRGLDAQGQPMAQAPAKAAMGTVRPVARGADTGKAASKPAPTAQPTGQKLAEQLNHLQAMMEERFNTLAWLGHARQDPIQSTLMHKLIRAGYSPTVARAVMERLPAGRGAADAFRWTQEVLSRNLRTTRDAGSLCDAGGVFALIGATGVGKTTTAAKLAAQCVQAYGANSVGLITLDTYRVAGYEQLRSYGRMLGVVAHLAHDRAALQDLLELLANKRMVIIDTAGLGQRDPRIQEMMELLDQASIKKLLVLNAGAHGDTLDYVVQAYKASGLYGVVLSKVDEAAKLGPALDVLIRHQVVLRGLSTGQRVPEDWQRPDAPALVRMSMGSSGKSAYDPQASELPFFFAEPMQTGVQLDGRHAA